MNRRTVVSRCVGMVRAFCVLLVAVAVAMPAVRAEEDFGDFSSATLTAKAWGAVGAGKLDTALVFTGKCRELYMEKALEQQALLDGFASD